MDEATFKNQLLRALKKPEEWGINNDLLHHCRASVYIKAPEVRSGSNYIFARGPDMEKVYQLLGDWRQAAIRCHHQVSQREAQKQREREKARKEEFLLEFEGFE